MINKVQRIATELVKESAKRVPYILLILLVLLLVQSYHNTQLARDNSSATKSLLKKVASLGEDNKRLSEENQTLSQQGIRLAQQNAGHIDCIKKLFVDYVNSGVLSRADADNCTVDAVATSETSQSSTSSFYYQVPASTAPKKQPDSPSTHQPAKPQSSFLGQAVDNVTKFLKGIR